MICKYCGQTIRKVGDEWWDAIGIGCSGQGTWGEVVMHVPDPIAITIPWGETFIYGTRKAGR